MKDLFSIGEMGKFFNINIRTLRYYDQIGLLKPEYVNEQTKYRYYSVEQFERLNTIKYLRALDVPIEQITDFFEHKDTEVMLSIFVEQKKEIARKQKELLLIEKKIDYRIEQLKEAMDTICGETFVRQFPERQVVMLRKEFLVSDNLEYMLRDLEREYKLEPAIFLGKVGVLVSRENLEKHSYAKFSAVFVVMEGGDSCENVSGSFAAGDYACIRFHGTHRESWIYYERLLKDIRIKGYRLLGDAIEITMIDAGLTQEEEKYVTELQIPVVQGDIYQ